MSRAVTEATEEIDPFLKRVVTVKPGDVVIYKYLGRLTPELVDRLTAQLKEKMGEIPFIVIDENFDLTVLKQSVASRPIHIA